MRYGKINEAIWNDTRFRGVSDSSRLFFIYLLSCSKCNSIGVFQIGLGTIEDEFMHDRSEIRSFLDELGLVGLVYYQDGWLWFNKYLKWNEPTSPNHARRCAADINDCIKKDAPVEAVWNFLGIARGILQQLSIKTSSGQPRTYYDEFKAVLDLPGVQDYLGGEEAFRNCLKGSPMPSRKNTGEVLQKGSGSTGQASTGEVLEKYCGSTSEALGNKDKTITNTKQITIQDKTKQKFVLACNNNEPAGISLMCSDGQPHAVGQAAIGLVAELYPGIDFDLLRCRIESKTMLDEDSRPEPVRTDAFFIGFAESFVKTGGK